MDFCLFLSIPLHRSEVQRLYFYCKMTKSVCLLFASFCVLLILAVSSTNALFLNQQSGFDSLLKRRCPLCDSSVYGYCSEKLFHDSCCCHNSNNPYDRLPYECQYADCSFLHANSCYEHKLISACCCTNYLF